MKTLIYHGRNTALFFYDGATGILVDGIHNGKNVGMSEMSGEWEHDLHKKTRIFGRTDALVFTHLHPDHFCEEKVNIYLEENNRTSLYGPSWEKTNMRKDFISDRLGSVKAGTAQIITMKTIHDGDMYRADPHESLIIKMGSETFFIAGDAELFEPDAGEIFQVTDHVDMAFVNLYQLGGKTGMEFLNRLKPDRILLYHLPEPEDDEWNYCPIGRQSVKRFRKQYGVEAETLEHMKWIDGERPLWSKGERRKSGVGKSSMDFVAYF